MKKFGIGIAVLACAMLIFSVGVGNASPVGHTRAFQVTMSSIYFDITGYAPNHFIGTEAEIETGWKDFHLLSYDMDCTTNYSLNAEILAYNTPTVPAMYAFCDATWMKSTDPSHSTGWQLLNDLNGGPPGGALVNGDRTSGSPGDQYQVWLRWDLRLGDFPTGVYWFNVKFLATDA